MIAIPGKATLSLLPKEAVRASRAWFRMPAKPELPQRGCHPFPNFHSVLYPRVQGIIEGAGRRVWNQWLTLFLPRNSGSWRGERRWRHRRFDHLSWPQIHFSFLGMAWSGKNAEPFTRKPGSQPGFCPYQLLTGLLPFKIELVIPTPTRFLGFSEMMRVEALSSLWNTI